MLAREYRISADKDIKRILKLGKRQSVPECSVYMMPNSVGHTRVCVVVASGVSKRAIVRNRLKRQAREVLRAAIFDGRLNRALDVVVMIRAASATITDEQRVGFYKKLFERCHILSS